MSDDDDPASPEVPRGRGPGGSGGRMGAAGMPVALRELQDSGRRLLGQLAPDRLAWSGPRPGPGQRWRSRARARRSWACHRHHLQGLPRLAPRRHESDQPRAGDHVLAGQGIDFGELADVLGRAGALRGRRRVHVAAGLHAQRPRAAQRPPAARRGRGQAQPAAAQLLRPPAPRRPAQPRSPTTSTTSRRACSRRSARCSPRC